MNDQGNSTPLIIHTLETLCNELVSGRSITIDDKGRLFQFTTPQERSIFEWYRKNQDKWSKNVRKVDVEEIADSIDSPPPDMPRTPLKADDQARKIFHLKSIKAHRFAGIHWYGEPENPPEDFYFELNKPLHLIEGGNGSGKTSFLNAICWCLSGNIYRAQRQPESVQSIELKISEIEEESNDMVSSSNATPITPIPSQQVLVSFGDDPVLLDTWVELKLEDDQNNQYTIKRCISRTTRGSLKIEPPDFSGLNIDPNALMIGTKMTGLIPYIQLEETSDIGLAVAAITGLKPLKDLSRHADKTKTKLKGELTKDRQNEIKELDKKFSLDLEDYQKAIDDTPSIKPEFPLPNLADENIENDLENLNKHFVSLQAESLSECKMILGDSFNSEDKEQKYDLLSNAGRALGQIDPANIVRLPSAKKLKDLAFFDDKSLKNFNEYINKLEAEAEELAKLELEPKRAVRLRLYARIAGWIKDNSEQIENLSNCPICNRPLKDIVDNETECTISNHIQHHLEHDSEYLEKTVRTWEEKAISSLHFIPSEFKEDLPKYPSDLIFQALCEELFNSTIFSKSLQPLKQSIGDLCQKEIKSLKPFSEPNECTLPECYDNASTSIIVVVINMFRLSEVAGKL